MVKGRIIKAYSGFYYVKADNNIYTCKARGVFKKDNIKPLVGDLVELEELTDKDVNGNIVAVLPRTSEIIRPSVANVDTVVIVFSTTHPKPKFSLIDKYIVSLNGYENIRIILCFNKIDSAKDGQIDEIRQAYADSDINLIFVSAKTGDNLEELKQRLKNHISVFTGPSGVGKTSLINSLSGNTMNTGDLSKKTLRGKQTTRHYELLDIDENTMILDTPGFTALNMSNIDYYNLKDNYPEMVNLSANCKFKNKCLHLKEPDCSVKKAVEENIFSKIRYDSYLELLNELEN